MENVRFLRTSPTADQPASDSATHLAELLAASARGDERAFAELYDLTASRVYGMVLRIVRDRAQSAEVTQDVYLQVWRESSRFDPAVGSAPGWLLMIAHRRAIDRVRSDHSARRRDDRYASLNTVGAYDQVAEQAHASLDAQRVHKVLSELTDVQREAVSLAYFGGYTHREVADLLHIPLGTVKTRIRDGLIRLRDALGVSDDPS